MASFVYDTLEDPGEGEGEPGAHHNGRGPMIPLVWNYYQEIRNVRNSSEIRLQMLFALLQMCCGPVGQRTDTNYF